jgi:hypothetical protein
MNIRIYSYRFVNSNQSVDSFYSLSFFINSIRYPAMGISKAAAIGVSSYIIYWKSSQNHVSFMTKITFIIIFLVSVKYIKGRYSID